MKFAFSLLLLILTSCRMSGRLSEKSVMSGQVTRDEHRIASLGEAAPGTANICSFNIQFLGKAYERGPEESEVLLKAIENCDLVAVQELIAPPIDMVFPNGDTIKADPEAKIFFDVMAQKFPQFAYVLSPEDTGRWENHNSANYSEFFLYLYRKDQIAPVDSPINGFLQSQLVGFKDCEKGEFKENTYDRVPHAQSFRFLNGGNDLVLINAHLHADTRKPCTEKGASTVEDISRRASELQEIQRWMRQAEKKAEKDFILIGDLNLTQPEVDIMAKGSTGSRLEIQKDEYVGIRQMFNDIREAGYRTLNDSCLPTNVGNSECFDHVIFRPETTKEIDIAYGFKVINLMTVAQDSGYCEKKPDICKNSRAFIPYFSDHNPVAFRWLKTSDDD